MKIYILNNNFLYLEFLSIDRFISYHAIYFTISRTTIEETYFFEIFLKNTRVSSYLQSSINKCYDDGSYKFFNYYV
jgi:hypothetical protein